MYQNFQAISLTQKMDMYPCVGVVAVLPVPWQCRLGRADRKRWCCRKGPETAGTLVFPTLEQSSQNLVLLGSCTAVAARSNTVGNKTEETDI
jgi:hypothetical protein